MPNMTSTKTTSHPGRDVSQLTDLMERFHTLSGLYESKRKNSVIREKTFHEGTRTSLRQKARPAALDNEEINPVPKPVPPLSLNKRKKSDAKRSIGNTKVQSKDILKYSETLKAKLHSGTGIGVRVFRLKDSQVEENVLQSVPQDDIQYSFHQPPLPSWKGEGSLYQEALASSQKYALANGGGDGARRLNRIRQQNSILRKSLLQKSTADITQDIRQDLGKAITPKNENSVFMATEKANTIADFNFDRKRDGKQRQTTGQGKIVFTKKKLKSLNAANGNQNNPKNQTGSSEVRESKESVRKLEKNSRSVDDTAELKTKRHVRSPPAAVLVDFSHENSLKTTDSSTFEIKRSKENSELDSNDKREVPIPTKSQDEKVQNPNPEPNARVIRMPKFVRTTEEMFPTTNEDLITAVQSRNDMSASSYYLSTFPKNTASLSSLKSNDEGSKLSTDSKLFYHKESIYDKDNAERRVVVTPPPSTLRSQESTPVPRNQNITTDTHLYPLSSIQKAYDVGKNKEKPRVARKQRRQLGKQGRIRKMVDPKDLSLETCVQGRSLVQNETEDETAEGKTVGKEKSSDDGNRMEKEGRKGKVHKEKIKSGNSRMKENISGKDFEKGESERKATVFNAYESFIIKSKHTVEGRTTRVSPEISDVVKAPRTPQKQHGRLAPLMKSNAEMQKSKFILARTNKSLDDLEDRSPVHLVSDPVSFSVRHPFDASSYPSIDKGNEQENMKPPRDLLLGRTNDLQRLTSERDDTVVVFFHHDSMKHFKDSTTKYGVMHKSALEPMLEKTPNFHDANMLPMTKTMKSGNIGQSVEKPDLMKSIKSKKAGDFDDDFFRHVATKTRGGGGFKANAAQYSMLLRQHQHEKSDQQTFLRLIQEDLLKQRLDAPHKSPGPKTVPKKRKRESDDLNLAESTKLTNMLKKFSHSQDERNAKPTGYTMFASRYPVQHEDSTEHIVQTQNLENLAQKAMQSSITLQYIWPNAKRRFSFPTGQPVKPPVKGVKSTSTGSDTSSTKSLAIKDLNFELKMDDYQKRTFVSSLARPPVSSKVREKLLMNAPASRYRHGIAFFTLPEITRQDQIREVDECCENVEGLDNLVYVDAHSAAILPDTGTATYRLANDISFDEGSRYNRSTDFPHGLKGKDDLRGQHMNVNGLTQQFGSSISMRGNEVARANSQSRQDGRYREHSSTNNPSFKDTAPVSLIRMEERCELPPAASPSTPTMPSAIAASASTPSFIPPSSASKPKTSATSLSGGSITFRMHKEKQNWNYRAGELSVSGGGYMNPLTGSSNPKQELDAINPINITSAVQRNLHTRERAMATASKSRMSSRYSSKMDSSGTNASYSDPCISAPPSFQQRLTDLSILESETIKYERSRKLRRKKNQDKDS